MVSVKERMARKLDDENLPITKSAARIKTALPDYALGTIENILTAKRAGYKSFNDYRNDLITSRINPQTGRPFASYTEYHDFLISKRVNPQTGRQFESREEYNDYLARQRGFSNFQDYVDFMKLRKDKRVDVSGYGLDTFNEIRDPSRIREIVSVLTEDLEERVKIEVLPSRQIDQNNAPNQDDRYGSYRANLGEALRALPKKWRTIVRERIFKERTLKEIGNELGLHAESVRQIQEKSLRILRRELLRLERISA